MNWPFGKKREQHLEPELLSEYLDGRLAPIERQRVEAHAQSCQACREELESLRATVAMLRHAPQPALRRSFVLTRAPAVVPARPRPSRVQAFAFSAAVGLVALFVTVTALDLGGALMVASPAPQPGPQFEALKASQPTEGVPVAVESVPPAPEAMPTPAPVATPTPAPLRMFAQDKSAETVAAAQAPVPPEAAPTPEATPVQEALVMAPEAPTPAPDEAPSLAVERSTPWAWRLAEGLLAGAALLLTGLGLWHWARRTAVR